VRRRERYEPGKPSSAEWFQTPVKAAGQGDRVVGSPSRQHRVGEGHADRRSARRTYVDAGRCLGDYEGPPETKLRESAIHGGAKVARFQQRREQERNELLPGEPLDHAPDLT